MVSARLIFQPFGLGFVRVFRRVLGRVSEKVSETFWHA